MKSLAQGMSALTARLNPRERLLVTVLVLLGVGSAAFLLLIEPAVTARTRNLQRIDALERDLPVMASLAERIAQLEAKTGRASSALPSAEFSLFAFIDKTAAASLTRESIASMNPSRHPLRDGKEETLVELRINGASLAEIVSFLLRIEQAEQPVYVKRLELKRRYEDKTRFDATVVTGALSRS